MYIRNDIHSVGNNQEGLKKTIKGLNSSVDAFKAANSDKISRILERQRGFEDIFGTSDQFGMRSGGSYGVPYRYAKDYNMSTNGVNMLDFEQENDENR